MLRTKKPAQKTGAPAVSPKAMIGDNLNFAAAEAYRLLRTNLAFSFSNQKKCRVIGITSSLRGEGKTTTSMNLAYAIAQTGKKVLLLEGDLRLPTMTKALGVQAAPGLSNLLVGAASGAEVVQQTELCDSLHVITAGDIPPNPSELLGSDQMAATIRALSEGYQYIIVDLPPVGVVSDAQVMSRLVDGMIVVVRRDFCGRQDLSHTMQQLALSNVKILGLVMCRAETENKRYKKYQKHNYGYQYGYSRKRSTKQPKNGEEK